MLPPDLLNGLFLNSESSPIDRQLGEAVAHHQAGELHLAEPLYRAVLQAVPRHLEANYQLGQLLRARLQAAAALGPLKTALDAASNQRRHWLAYAEALAEAGQLPAARQILAQGRQRGLHGAEVEALAARFDAATGQPPSPSPLGEPAAPPPDTIDYAIGLFNGGRFTILEPVVRDLAQRFPGHGFGWQALGLVLKHLGRDREALPAMQRTVELLPDDAEAHYNLGVTQKDLGAAEAAVASYRRALELQPGYAEAHGNLAAILLGQGDAAGAEAGSRRALALQPGFVPALVNLGNALLAQGRAAEAAASHRQALALAADSAEAHCGLGAALAALGELPAATDAWRRGLALRPGNAEGQYQLGLLLAVQGRHGEAEAVYRQALALAPDSLETQLALAGNLGQQGRVAEAETAFRQLLAAWPELAEAHYGLAFVLTAQRRPGEAEASYRQALALRPDHAEAANNLGNLLCEQGRLAAAETEYRRAADLRPDFVGAHCNLGKVLIFLGRSGEAEAAYRRALALRPTTPEAYGELGAAFHDLGQLAEATASYRAALALDPDFAPARLAAAMLALPPYPQSIDEADAAPALFAQALDHLAAWVANDETRRRALAGAIGTRQPLLLAYRDGDHAALLSRYGDLVAHVAATLIAAPALLPPPRARLRLAIVSHHLYRHSVWDIVIRGMVEHIDRSRFEVVLYNVGNIRDTETEFARAHADLWRDKSAIHGAQGWLDAIRADSPDVIFYPEIGMDAMALRLAACRLAPLQVAGWGHPITTGLPTIDLYLSGELFEAPGADTHYREQLVRLPGTGCCTSPIAVAPEPLAAATMALLARMSGPRFIIAQLPFKFDPADDELYVRIATQVPDASFILVEHPIAPTAMAQVEARLQQAFSARGLDPRRYLHVLPWQSRGQFLSLLDACDIYLDCPSFSGYTTAWQAIQRGLPVLTRAGRFLRQRLAAGLLRRIGITDTIVATADDYVAAAVRLAAECKDPARRDARRRALVAAAPRADHDLGVVRAFERTLLTESAARGRRLP